MSIEDKTVLITGANRGIGRALVEEALRRGAKRVYAGARQPWTHTDERVTPLVLDVTSAAQIAAAAERVESLDILVNNAGLGLYADLSDRAALERHLAVNLFGPYDVIHAFVPRLVESRGAIVNVLSLAALAAVPLDPTYAISKAAALSLTQSVRLAVAQRGVSVHAVLPGPVDTDMGPKIDVPKASPESVARAIFDGVRNADEDIFPDAISGAVADSWRGGVAKSLERQFAALAVAEPGSDFSTSTTIDGSPAEVFAAILDARQWWNSAIDGPTSRVGGEFGFEVEGLHRTRIRVTDLTPNQRVEWLVLENEFGFTTDQSEWIGNRIVFELQPADGGTTVVLTQYGLDRGQECYDVCSKAWDFFVDNSLRPLVETGRGNPESSSGQAAPAERARVAADALERPMRNPV